MNWGLLDLFLIELLDLPLCKFNLVNSEITYRKETYLKTSPAIGFQASLIQPSLCFISKI